MTRLLKSWRRRFFREEIFTPGQPEAIAAAPREASFVWRALGLRRGQRVLDLCCGTGRHSAALARKGALVLGVDSTPEYLAAAKRLAGPRLSFRLGDMRNLPFHAEFDAAINLWTSFGYFADPRDDLRTLRKVRNALRPGGLFLIDLMNAAWLRRHFQPKKWQRRGDGSYLLEDSRLVEGRDPRVESEWTILRKGRAPARAMLMVRQYDWRRLSTILKQAGLRPVRRWGSLDGLTLTKDSNRLVVLSRRPR